MTMAFHKTQLSSAIAIMLSTTVVWAQEEKSVPYVHQLPMITVQVHPLSPNQNEFANAVNVIEKERLSQGATSLGDALNGQLGVHSDNFGAGSSRPVIRGQTAPRVKVLTDSSEVMDASQISPDHAVTVAPSLSTKIEVLRGPSTLLYGGGAIGGVVNVLDEKIPTSMPENGSSGEVHLRGNTAANEKLGAAGITVGLGDQFAMRIEGSKFKADDYQVPHYQHDGHRDKRLAGTWSEGENASLGLSWIGDRGYVGMAYTERNDKYALPGHSHEYESCHPHELSLHCGEHNSHADHDHDDHDDAHDHEEHEHSAPWVDLKSQRFDVRAEYNQPFAGIEKIRARASYTDYRHHEVDDGQISTTFKNKGYDGRLEFVHTPIGNLEGVFGVQYAKSDFQALGAEAFLPQTETENLAAFIIEHYQWNDVHFELGGRIDKQTIQADGEHKNFDKTAFSASTAANWEFAPEHIASLTLSYAERLPNTQELYAKGVHLATNTYEIGDENLNKEASKNIEFAVHNTQGDFSYGLNVFYNQIDDYIYAHTLDRHEDFRLIQYRQADANFYGAEAEIGYQLNDYYKAKIFADHVHAELDQGGDLPRIPTTRAGVRFDADFLDGIHGGVEYIYGFKQTHIASFENETPAYHLVNLDVSYDRQLTDRLSSQVYLRINNLLDENYYNHASYLSTLPQQGRNFTAGVRFRF